MSDGPNPLIPSGYDMAWSVLAVLLIALTIAALFTLMSAAAQLSATQALVWTLVVLFLPVVGSITWLIIGRRAAPARPNT